MVPMIGRELNLGFNPTLLSFGEGRVCFFCPSEEAIQVVERNLAIVEGEKVFPNSWTCFVKTINMEVVTFRGWISIKGLPFYRWNGGTFNYVGQQRGGLREIDYNSKNFLKLSEARIQVNAKSISSIPSILHPKVEAQWLHAQLSPIFTPTDDSRPVGTAIKNGPRRLMSTKRSSIRGVIGLRLQVVSMRIDRD